MLSFVKGWGVVSVKKLHLGEFILEYRGELVSEESISRRQAKYDRENAGSYIYEFMHQGKTL